MKRRFLTMVLTMMIILFTLCTTTTVVNAAESEYAWILVDVIDYENAEKWAAADAHGSYIVKHGYSRGNYSASTTYEGDDPYDTGLGGALSVKANFTGVPDIIYPNKPVSLKFSFVTIEDTVNKLSFTILKRKAHAFSHWDESVGFGFEKYLIKV